MDLGLKGKTAIVTGGASNIGRGISMTLAAEGANVVIADIDEKQAAKVVDIIVASGGKAIAVKTDVTDYNQVEAMVKKVLEQFKQVDILVNDAGGTKDARFLELPREEWDRTLNLTLKSMLNCCRAVLPHMVERKAGAIVSIGSDAGRAGQSWEAVYSAAKGGVIASSKAIAQEVGKYGVRLNVVCPGMTRPFDYAEEVGQFSMQAGKSREKEIEKEAKVAQAYPLKRIGRPQDIGNAVAFLVSDKASFITGQTLSVSGGYTMM